MGNHELSTGVSVVVATARPDEVMDACVAAVAQSAARLDEPVELIIVDDRDLAGEARRPALERRDGLEIRRLFSRAQGVSGQPEARNLGAAAARYDVLALTDDDALPDPGWLEAGVRRLRSEPWLAGVEGAVRIDPRSMRDAARSRIVFNQSGGACMNASMFYRTAAYRSVGGSRFLWHRPPMSYREDTDLAMRVKRQVGAIAFEPAAFVVHPVELVSLGRLLRLGRYFSADAVLGRLHPGSLGSLTRRPLARLRIRLATALTLLVPGLAHRRTRTATGVLIAAITAAISAQFEVELRAAGVTRGAGEITRDTIRRLPRALLWALAAGSARIQSELMVRTGLVQIPPERPEPLGQVPL